jgi:hypothetical protein
MFKVNIKRKYIKITKDKEILTYTEYAQGAWWQVDLGSKKDIKQIIIYNRTDCCAARLSNFKSEI